MPTESVYHVLILDPDIQLTVPLVNELESNGYQVSHITSWETRADVPIVRSYHVIVIAWQGANNSPLQFIPEWVRQQSPKCPLILALAPGQLVDATHLQSCGVQHYISRPYKIHEALKAIREVALQHETEVTGRSLDRAALLNLAADIFSVQDEQQLLDRIVNTLVNTFGYKVAYFRLIGPDGSLATYASAGTRINYVGHPRYQLPPGAGITGWVVQHKRPKSIRDLREEPGFYFPDMKEREGMVAMLSVPLISGDAVLGVLTCYLGEPHEFTETETRFVCQWANLASIAINNTRLIKIQNQLSLFSRELAQASDLKSVLQIVLYHAQQLTGADGVSIFPYNTEKKRFELESMLARGIGDSQRLARKERPRSEGISMTVLRRGVVRVEDVDKAVEQGLLKSATRDELVRQDVRAFVGIALQASHPAGALFLNYRRAGYLPPMEMLEPLETLSYQAALAFERARENEYLDHVRRLQLLATDVIASINSKDSVDTAWKKLLQAAKVLTKAKVGNIGVITPDGRYLRQVAVEGFPDEVRHLLLEIGGKSILGQVAQLKEPILISNVKTDPIWSAFYHEGVHETLSELTVPIFERQTGDEVDRSIIGIINLEHPEESAFGEHDKKLLELMCEHAKVIIKTAQDWERLTKQQDQLNALFNSVQTISAALDKETLLQTILEQAAQLAGAHFTTIQRNLGDRLRFEAVYPPERMAQLRSQIPDGEMPMSGRGLTVEAARTRRPVRVGNIQLRLSDYVDGSGKVTQSELAVPVLIDGDVWGVLNVESSRLDAFDHNDEKTIVALSELVAAALKYIERQGELEVERKRRARIETVNEFSILTMHMAHGLKDLLSNISPEAAKIRENLGAASTDVVRNRQDIHRSLDQMTLVSHEAIEILKTIRRPFLSKLERRVDVAEVLNHALERMRPFDSTVIRTPEWSEDRFVISSRMLLEDVLKNLLDNAQDAIPHGGIINISIRDSRTEWLSISVHDNGSGMSQAALEEVRKILPGYSTKDERKRETRGGFGFGLYVANWFMRRLGGSLAIDSSTSGLDHGTTITLTLPKDTPRQWAYLLEQEQLRDPDQFLYRRNQ